MTMQEAYSELTARTNHVPFSKQDYDASCVQYEKLADSKLKNTGMIILERCTES